MTYASYSEKAEKCRLSKNWLRDSNVCPSFCSVCILTVLFDTLIPSKTELMKCVKIEHEIISLAYHLNLFAQSMYM
jgi:hypothetical protein